MPTFRGRQQLIQLRIRVMSRPSPALIASARRVGYQKPEHLLLRCLALLHVRRADEHLLPPLSTNMEGDDSRLAQLLSSPQAQPLTNEQMHRLQIVGTS